MGAATSTVKTGIPFVQKRDGTRVSFNPEKIALAVLKALTAVNEPNPGVARQAAERVVQALEEKHARAKTVPTVEEVQDLVEEKLMQLGQTKAAKAYILYREEHTHTREEQKIILNGKTSKLGLTTNALKVLAKRYLQKDELGKVIETPEQMFERVARVLAEVERKYGAGDGFVEEQRRKFYEVMASFEFTPAGRTLTNAGAPTPVVSNCIVLHPTDSLEGIFQTLKEATLLQQLGSGLGFPWHLLRPAGTRTKRTQGEASGPVSFLRVYDKAFGVIKQQGRHGANMAIMKVDHPDILEFVNCKRVEGEIRNFNISVGLTDEFMQKVINNDSEPYLCQFNGIKMKPRRVKRDRYDLIVELLEETLTARELFNEIVEAAWTNGEPGIGFLDTVNATNPLPGLGRIEACNPCGEQYLHDGDVCNLGSINLEKFVKNREVDYERLKEVTRRAIQLLDNVVDITDYPVERVARMMKGNRRIGLGVMGFADMLYQLGVAYNSEEGIQTAEKVMNCIQTTAHEESQNLAEKKGTFPNYDSSIYKPQGVKMRNAALTTVAPTGTISMMFDVSSGIEPVFALSYYKGQVMGSTVLYYVNRHFEKALRNHGLYSDELMRKVSEHGSVQSVEGIPEDLKRTFVVAHDISPYWHMRMQAAFQKHVDNSISKTINFPHNASAEDVKEAYVLAYKLGCKGMTVYRDGSRQVEVLTVQDPSKKNKATQTETSEEIQGLPGQKGICPTCQTQMRMEEGCATCPTCGLSYCTV